MCCKTRVFKKQKPYFLLRKNLISTHQVIPTSAMFEYWCFSRLEKKIKSGKKTTQINKKEYKCFKLLRIISENKFQFNSNSFNETLFDKEMFFITYFL